MFSRAGGGGAVEFGNDFPVCMIQYQMQVRETEVCIVHGMQT